MTDAERWKESERNWNMLRSCVMVSDLPMATKRALHKFIESVEENGYEPYREGPP